MKYLPLACAMAFAVTAAPQVPDAPRPPAPTKVPRTLYSSERVRLDIPMFESVGRTLCDASGDMFFDVGSMLNNRGPFLRISSDGKHHLIYSLPKETDDWGNIVAGVSPAGTLYVLFENFREYKLIRFKSDGTVADIASLQVPPRVDVQYLAVADSGVAYVRGYHVSHDPNETNRPGFSALFNGSGKMTRDLSATAPNVDRNPRRHGPADGDAAAGEDGRFYILSEKSVRILNQAGELEKEISFEKPSPEAHAVQVDFSKGRISILFQTLRGRTEHSLGTVEVQACLLNAQTGELEGNFVFAAGLSNNVQCFNMQEGYTLAANDGDNAAMDVVPIK